MALREFIASHQRSVLLLVVLVIGGTMTWAGSQLFSSQEIPASNQLFFSADDGRTWFRDSADRIPPFDHNGKPAYQVFVWTTDGGKTQFVSHLFRYTPAGLKRMQSQANANPAAGPGVMGSGIADSEVKRPGDPDNAWIKSSDPRAADIVLPKPTTGNLEPVNP